MTTFAVSMAKDESDVVEHVIRHIMGEVDGMIVADNLSSDDTRSKLDALVDEYCGRLIVVEDNEVGYYQSAKMTALAARAHHEFGAEWIIPMDMDEIWYSREERLSVVLDEADPLALIYPASLWNHFPSSIDPPGDNPFVTIGWRQVNPGELPKVAFRWRDDAVIHQGNHGVSYSTPVEQPHQIHPGRIELRHFPYRSFEQFKRKAFNGAAAYKATDLPEHQGAHWRSYGQILEQHGEEALREVFTTYFWFLSPVDAGLVYDPAPYARWS